MSKVRKIKAFANVTLLIVLLGTLVFTSGFGLSLHIAQQEVISEVDRKVQRDIDYLNSFIDGNLQRIEDAGYSFSSLVFGDVILGDDGQGYINLNDPDLNRKLSLDVLYDEMEKFMRATPIVCGIAIEFEPYVYPEIKSQYGFTPYVTNVSGQYEHLDLGEITNSFEWEWYIAANQLGKGHWNKPFQDSSIGHVIACYSIPVLKDGQPFAVIAVDIDTEAFSKKSAEISPYPGAQVTILDRDFSIISNPDKSYLMKDASELEGITYSVCNDDMKELMTSGQGGQFRIQSGDTNYMMYFSPVARTGWTITIQCPESEVYGGVDRMKSSTTTISVFSIILMSLVLVLIFRHFRNISIKEAGIEKELNVASGIQSGMLPHALNLPDSMKRLDIFGFQKPAKSVGGDLYDYFVEKDKLYFCIGDVSGKGVPASLYMVVILALFRNIARKESDPSKIAIELNDALISSNNDSMFCTMFIGVLDMNTWHWEYCNAGHNKPMIFRRSDAAVSYKEVLPNVVIGIMEDFQYIKEETDIQSGDSIFLYTDGLTEAENEEKVLYGDDAALAAFKESVTDDNSEKCVHGVLESVMKHTNGAEQNDDITMLTIRLRQ